MRGTVSQLCSVIVVVILLFWSSTAHSKSCEGAELQGLIDYITEYDGSAVVAGDGSLLEVSLSLLRVSDEQIRLIASSSNVVQLDLSSELFTIGELSDAALVCLVGTGSLKTLRLSGHVLTDRALVDIGRMQQLQALDLTGVPVTNESMTSIAALTELRSLHLGQLPFRKSYRHYFRGFNVSDDGFKALKSLTNLEDLTVYGLTISDAVADTINSFKRLTSLNVGFTNLTKLGLCKLVLPQLHALVLDGAKVSSPASCLERFPGLQTLGLRYLPLAAPTFKSLQNMKSLSRIDLGGTNLGDSEITLLADLPITEADLSETNITDLSLDVVSNWTDLETLNLDQTIVSDLGARKIIRLKNIRKLSLASTLIGNDSKSLVGVGSLQELDVSNTGVSDEFFFAMGKSKTLVRLNAADTELGDTGLHALVTPTLRELNVSRTQITDIGMQSWMAPAGLQSLSLEGIGIEGRGFARLGDNLSLDTLKFADNPISSGSLEAFSEAVSFRELGATRVAGIAEESLRDLSDLTKIHTLELAGSSITDKGLSLLAEFDRMHCFDLARSNVTAEGLSALGEMDNVHSIALDASQIANGGIQLAKENMAMFFELYLIGEEITDRTLSENVEVLAGLKELALFGTRVSDEGLEVLAELDGMHTIRVAGGPISQEGISAFQLKQPSVAIVLLQDEGWKFQGAAGRAASLKAMP